MDHKANIESSLIAINTLITMLFGDKGMPAPWRLDYNDRSGRIVKVEMQEDGSTNATELGDSSKADYLCAEILTGYLYGLVDGVLLSKSLV